MIIFKNNELQEKFNRDGYVVVPLIDIDTVHRLNDLYRLVQPVSYKGFSSTIFNRDIALKKETSNKIENILSGYMSETLQDFRPLGCSFLCKTSGEESFMPAHQDWTIVDESKFASVTIWMPLVDTTENNGALRVLPGSHKFSNVLRSPTLPGAFQEIISELYDATIPLLVKAGEAVIFNQALIHASTANMSDADRVVATYGLVHKDAQLSFYHQVENRQVEQYAIADDFFITYNDIGSPPTDGQKVNTFSYSWGNWNLTDLKVALARTSNKSYTTKMKRLFKDENIQSFFEKNGYAKFKILDESEVKELLNYYQEQDLGQKDGPGFTMSMELSDKEKVAKVREKIYEVALPKALPYYFNARVIAGSYVVKEHNLQCIVPPHQDWSFVDNEGEYCSVTCWIPLVDTTIKNGAMGVIKGSHLMLNNIRSSPSPQVPTPLMDHQFTIFPYLEMIEMKAGEALVFDHRTFHASTPNTTKQPRVAIGLGFTQQEATICHYTLKQNGTKDTLLKYYVDDAFLLKYDNSLLSRMYENHQSIEGYEVAEELPFNFTAPTIEELTAMVTQAGNTMNIELSTYLANLFGFNTNTTTEKVEEQIIVPIIEDAPAVVEPKPWKGAYTPMNILREIKIRLLGK
jgi:ectoine hydroxylase-related dioxygenase (phytanoyl-CoA dioxygenase family)